MLLDHKSVPSICGLSSVLFVGQRNDQLAPDDYSGEDVERRIKTAPHVVVIQPESDIDILVEIEIHEAEPASDRGKWDHIAEASLHVPTGQLQVHECTGGPVADFQVNKGWYRVHSFHAGLDSYYGGEGDRGDSYRVVLWPAPPGEVQVLKQYSRPK